MTRANAAQTNESLPFLSSQERLQAYQLLVDGCAHLWSKNKIQTDKVKTALLALMPLVKSDPYFLAHLTSYVHKQKVHKDLQVLTAYAAALSSADGMPFSPGSQYMKPNLRYVGWAAVQHLDPKLAERIVQMGEIKYSVPDLYNEARHFPTALKTALERYLQYRENNLEIVQGIKKVGLGSVLKKMYTKLRLHPTDQVAEILRWQQKDHHVEISKAEAKFKDKTDLEIAEIIRSEKMPLQQINGELSRVGKKISPVIAVAMLEQVTPNQAVIIYGTFADAGILKDPEVKKLYEEKIKTDTTLDRVERIQKIAEDQEAKDMLTNARSVNRQERTAGIGKIFLHLDFSGSMSGIQQFAIDRGAIFAECVNNPTENFAWGIFGASGERLPLPKEFVKDAFSSILFARPSMGGTDCFALYPEAREFGADVDVFVSDQDHTYGDFGARLEEFHRANPTIFKPKACVVVDFSEGRHSDIKAAYERIGVPVSELKPDALKESALVAEAVKVAALGPVAVVDEIMATELLKLPEYYYSLNEAVPD